MKDKLLSAIIDNTKNSTIVWYRTKSMFNSESAHYYECKLHDGSLVKLEVHLNKDNLRFDYCNHIIIENKKLVDGRLFIHIYDNKKVAEIGQIVYQMYVNPNIAPRIQSQDQVLSDIITAIPTKEQSRDNKILEIIGDVENKFPWAMSEESQKKLVKIDQEVDEKMDQNKDETKKENKSKLRKILSVLLLNKWCKTRS